MSVTLTVSITGAPKADAVHTLVYQHIVMTWILGLRTLLEVNLD